MEIVQPIANALAVAAEITSLILGVGLFLAFAWRILSKQINE